MTTQMYESRLLIAASCRLWAYLCLCVWADRGRVWVSRVSRLRHNSHAGRRERIMVQRDSQSPRTKLT